MKQYRPPTHSRRGVVVAFVAVTMFVLLGFAALAVDVGHLYATRAELQRSADAAALAAATRLGDHNEIDSQEAARIEASRICGLNAVFNVAPDLGQDDVEFGTAVKVGNRFTFQPGGSFPDAVRVSVRRAENSPNGQLPLFFAGIFGKTAANVGASASAMLVPRDIAIVADLSTSHNEDSLLKNMLRTEVNTWDVWAGLSGGMGNTVPLEYGAADEQVEQFAGPLLGYMRYMGWGTTALNESYQPSADAGLAYLPRYNDWNNAVLSQALAADGYTSDEINAIMSDAYDSSKSTWRNRVGVALGLATWDSGRSELHARGDGDAKIESNEVTWVDFPQPGGSWDEWITDYTGQKNLVNLSNGENFRYRFGAKTLTDYIVAENPYSWESPALADAPTQPMQAIKDAVAHLTDLLDELNSLDHLSLEVYDTTSHHEIDLTADFYRVSDRLKEMQAGYYSNTTNMGAGIQEAIDELTGPRARDSAKKVMFLLTDGLANVNGSGDFDYAGGKEFARAKATAAAELGIQIYTVSVGAGADSDFMQELADIGGGLHFHAEGTPDQYTAELQAIFARLGGTRSVVLIE